MNYPISSIYNSPDIADLEDKPKGGTLLHFGGHGSSLCAGPDDPPPDTPAAEAARIDAELRRDGILN